MFVSDPLYETVQRVETECMCSFGRDLDLEVDRVTPARRCPGQARHRLDPASTGVPLWVCEQHMRAITEHYWIGASRSVSHYC